jgi:hypothetical protein
VPVTSFTGPAQLVAGERVGVPDSLAKRLSGRALQAAREHGGSGITHPGVRARYPDEATWAVQSS